MSFFIVIGIGLELKSGLSPSLRSYCGIYSNHPSCLPTTQLNGTPKKYLSREKTTTYFLNSHCFYSSTWKYLFFEEKNNKTHPAVTAIHIPITTKILEATWLTFALESVQKSIIYPLKQWKMWVSGKLAAGLRDFWEPNVLSEWTVGSSAPIQLRRNLQTLLFTLTIWLAANSPLVEVVVVLDQSKRGINSLLQSFTHPPLLVLQESWSPKQPYPSGPFQAWTPEEEGRRKLQRELNHELQDKCLSHHTLYPTASLSKVNPIVKGRRKTGREREKRETSEEGSPSFQKKGYIFPWCLIIPTATNFRNKVKHISGKTKKKGKKWSS